MVTAVSQWRKSYNQSSSNKLLFKHFKGIRTMEEYENMNVLPGPNTTFVLMESFKVLIARTIVSFLPSFKLFNKQVTRHIDHPFKKEMSTKSEIVIYFVIFFFLYSTITSELFWLFICILLYIF